VRRKLEHGLQVGVARLLGLVLDPDRTWWSAIDHAAQLSARYGADRKRRGVKRGLPDFLVLTATVVLGIELKAGKGKLTPEQSETATEWRRLGLFYEVARSLREVQDILELYGVPMVRRMKLLS
jgi:hypothetical protein